MPEIRERNGDPISRLWTQTLNRSYFCAETRKTIKACRKNCENKLKAERRKLMKREDVSKIFEGATEEQINSILNINSADIGKAKGDYDTLKKSLEDMQTAKKTLETKVTELESANGDAAKYKKDLEALQKQIADEKAEAERKAAEEAAETECKSRFDSAVGEKKWRDELTGNAVYGMFKTSLADTKNKGKSDSEILEMITKDKNYYENPNKPADMQGMGFGGGELSDNDVRAVMGLPPLK